MRKSLLLFIALLVSVGSHLLAQQEVRFGQYTVLPEQNVARTRGATVNALEAITPTQGKVNVLMQFREVPDAALQRELDRAGVVLEGYLGGNAYYAQVKAGSHPSDFAGLHATSVIGLRPEWKVSPLLSPGQLPPWADRGNGRAAVTVSWFSNADAAFVRGYFASRGIAVSVFAEELAMAVVELPLAEVQGVAEQPWVRRVRPVAPPQEPNNYSGGVLSAGKYLALPSGLGGRGLTGKGVRVGLWDGNVEPHVDYGNRIHVLEFEMSLQQSGGHGMHTCGTISGAGLLDPKGRGIAPEVELYAMNFNVQSNGLIPQAEMLQLHEEYNIALTSNSYGFSLRNLCRFYKQLSYSALGTAYPTDLLSYYLPYLTHIYAAGNDQGQCDRKYGTSTSRAKNVIYVGAVDAVSNMSNFSSWGPMDDGRLIPTVSAKGVATYSTVPGNGYQEMSGTSMACPTVTGIVSLLTERYHQLHGGKHMNSALVMGILANTADDTGNPGPDYQYGYGIVNAEAAVRAIENGWYHNDTVRAGSPVQPFSIKVPSGVKQLRVMLTWIDPAVDKEYPYGQPALINDLDLSLNVGGKVEKPWILKAAEPALPATRGLDTINIIEQVTIDNPTAGDVKVLIAGHDKVRAGRKQGYTITWYFDYKRPLLLHPAGGELFAPGDNILLRANNMVGTTKAEISYDGGKTYTYMGRAKKFYSINLRIPEDAKTTVDAKVRLTDEAGNVLVNEHPFTIAGQPQNLKLTSSDCSLDDWKLTWDKVTDAEKYKVLKADVPSGKWEELGEATSEEFKIEKEKIVVGGRNVYAVAVELDDKTLGPRSKGLLAEKTTPITLAEKDLPYLESFVTLPPVGASFIAGKNLAVQAVETPPEVGYPMGSRMILLRVIKDAKKDKKAFEDPDNVFAIKICKLNLKDIDKSKKIVFNAVSLMQQATQADVAQVKLEVDGKSAPVTTGGESVNGNGNLQQLYWDISEHAGKENVTLELKYTYNEKNKGFIIVGYSIFEATTTPDIGLYVQRGNIAPKPNMKKEKLHVSLYSSSAAEVSSVPIVVRLDGKVAMTHVEKNLKPFEQREVEIPVDFTSNETEGHMFKVKVSATAEGDATPRNDTASCEVYNMGNIYPHPVAKIVSFFGMKFPEDPMDKVEVDTPIVYTDMGGTMGNYSHSQLSSVKFYPKDPTKAIQVTFTEWSFGAGDSLRIYASNLRKPFVYTGEDVSYKLKGESEGRQQIAVSQAKEGEIYLYFSSSDRSRGGRGWKAIVQAVPRVNFLTLEPIQLAERYESGEAAIKIKVKNNTPIALRYVKGEIKIDGEKDPIAFEIPVVQANKEMNAVTEFEIPTKLKVPYPTLLNLTVKVFGDDVDMSDNVQKVRLRNDKFWYGGTIKTTGTQGIKQVKVMPNKVEFKGVTRNDLAYHLDNELIFYTESENPLQVKLKSKMEKDKLPAALHVWIDVDESDNALKNKAPEYYTAEIQENVDEYTLKVDLKNQKPGKRRMRIAVLPGKDTVEAKKFIDEKQEVEWGCAVDITADIREGKNPKANDLGLKFFTPIASGHNLSKDQELKVSIVNYGHTARKGFNIKVLVNEEQKIEEKVEQEVQPLGGSIQYTLKQKLDLSKSNTAYNIELKLDDDDVLDNNTVSQRVVSLPAQNKNKLYALDFKKVKDEGIDYSSLSSLAKLGSMATIEGWFYLRHGQVATLFESIGVYVVSTYKLKGIPDNAIAIICGNGQMNVTEANKFMPGQFHHLAITFNEQSSWFSANTELKVYIDGEEAKTTAQGGDGFNFAGLVQAGRLDGQVKMLRVWKKVLKDSDIKGKMHDSVRMDGGNLPQDCVAEFMMNEGTFGFIGSGNDAAELLTKRVDHKDSNIWVDLSKQLIAGVKFENQLLEAKLEKEGEFTFLMPHDWDVNKKLKGEVFTLWKDTKVEYDGKKVEKDTEFDFNKDDKTITLKATVEKLFGQKLEQEVKVRLVIDKSPKADISKLSLLTADNPNLKSDITVDSPDQTVRLSNVEDAAPDKLFDISHSKITIDDLSEGATVAYKDQKAKKGEKLTVDLSRPVSLEVTAENARDKKYYTVQIDKSQSITWDNSDLSYTFTTKTEAMGAKSSSGLPVVYLSEDENVATVDGDGKLHTSGVGETTLTAYTPASGIYKASDRVTRKVKVTPAELTISPVTLQIEEGEAIPELEFEYAGRLFSENPVMFKPVQYAVYKDANTKWEPSMGPLPKGTYNVKPVDYTQPYVDGNYTVTLQSGKLEVKASKKNKSVTLTVVDRNGGAALKGAQVSIAKSVLTTDDKGNASIVLAPGKTYPYTVSLADYAEAKGEVELKVQDEKIRVELGKLEVTLKYVAEANGSVAGKLTQRLPKGSAAEEVVAVPDLGYKFTKWEDGSTEATRRDKSVSADAEHKASFEELKFKLTYEVSEGGEVESGNTSQDVQEGKKGEKVKVKAKSGYHFAGWSDGVAKEEREDVASENLKVKAQYYKAFELPLCQDFEEVDGLPYAWEVSNESKKPEFAMWKFGISDDLPQGTRKCVRINTDDAGFFGDTKASLVSPWIDISKLNTSDLQVSFTLQMDKSYGQKKLKLQYRTDPNSTKWEEAQSYMSTVYPPQTKTVEVKNAKLTGNQEVQFRWFMDSRMAGVAAVDNVVISVKEKAVILYVAGEHGKVKKGSEAPTNEVKIETNAGTDGDKVTAEPDDGYIFDRWSDGKKEAERQDKQSGRFKAHFKKKPAGYVTFVYEASEEGCVRGAAYQPQVEKGTEGTPVTAEAVKEGYHFAKWSDGKAENLRVDKAESSDLTVKAEFEINVYTLAYSAGEHGRIEGKLKQEVQHGSDGEMVTAVADKGFHFEKWSDGSTENPRTDKVVKRGIEVKAAFAADLHTELKFVVKDANGTALQDAKVKVEDNERFTDAEGKTVFALKELREYSYSVSKAGFKTVEGKKTLEAGGTTVEVKLEKKTNAVESVLLNVVTLRPNPASATLYVEYTAAVEHLSVVTLQGEVLLQKRNLEGAPEVTIPLASVADGMYLLVVEGDGAQRTIPFVVTK